MSAVCSMFVVLLLLVSAATVEGKLKNYKFDIQLKNVSRLCHAKSIVTVNGQFPGPTIYAREGDTVLINVTNHLKYNMSIHWHGIRQLRTGWADGPAYITQCPVQTGQSYTYNFTITGQRGTLFWHAHILWLRATVYGPIVILPKVNVSYPFPKPHKEITVMLGEWWNADVEAVINEAMKSGGAPNVSDTHTINGKPGPLGTFTCPTKDTFVIPVQQGKTYLLRIINAALNDELFFDVARHKLKVVEVDAVYTKSFDTKSVVIAPGQTTNVLLQANQKPGRYFMAARTYMDAPVPVDNRTATAILQYMIAPNSSFSSNTIAMPQIPSPKDTSSATNFNNALRSLNSAQYPAKVPQTVDRTLFFTVGLAIDSCTTCINGSRISAAINNVSFVMPTIALLQAHFQNITGVFTTDFPDKPPTPFNYTGIPPKNLIASKGTRLTRLSYNSKVQLVLQDTSVLTADNHPIHLHGFNFFIVGSGFGNYDPIKDPKNFNLVDPPERNTVAVPTGGWSAIRFTADNPGVWFMHCHLEVHTTWGLKMAFVVENGNGPNQSILPPPNDLPKC
ncbi:hypothetical protein SUGI_0351470 [Cryptomeria japonica]|uniref:laccase-11 n=1 Tax=Cryptomeria japonica TaxID=3369 RepID=UPI002408BCFD|nr:laccase-11 [Cryptomeria japonica]GLJ19466.1 hypothetical protein SUGI_0351470 [Cryptomeria japonica]